MSAQPPKPMQLSPDGRYYWAGTDWVPTLSPSGRWLWDGTQWRPVGALGLPSPKPQQSLSVASYPQAQNSVQQTSAVMMYRSPTNSLAVASLVFGIVSWFVCPLVGSVMAVIFGHMAHSQLKTSGEGGAGMATAGLALGYVSLAGWLVFGFFWLAVFGGFAAILGTGAASH